MRTNMRPKGFEARRMLIGIMGDILRQLRPRQDGGTPSCDQYLAMRIIMRRI